MRAKEFITEAYDVEYYEELTPVVLKAWNSVYPDVTLNVKATEGMWMRYTTADEYKSGPGGGQNGNGVDFYLSIVGYYASDAEPTMGYINIGDAYANNYTGAVSKIIAAIFEWLEQKHPDIGVRELGISINRNEEAWNAIAKKVGARVENRGLYTEADNESL